ncbi:MAG: hypothetical protein COB53_01735 [Elusimicrobia bacterium]|nr:MAG: hypothetical protein COB53_01735 [Elusimicrobiota bacterium]
MTTTEKISELDELELQILELKKKRAELRQKLTPEKVADHVLIDHDNKAVKLSELFGDKKDLLVIHNMGTQCPYCTLWADGLDGQWQYISDRAAAVVVSADSVETQKAFKAKRGWSFPMLSGEKSEFIKAMGFEGEDHPDYGKFKPGVSAFRKNEDGSIVRISKAPFGPGDDFCAVWPLFDLLQDGHADWQPKFNLKKN